MSCLRRGVAGDRAYLRYTTRPTPRIWLGSVIRAGTDPSSRQYFDVTEVAVPWRVLTDAGHDVVFATERGGEPPMADPACWME